MKDPERSIVKNEIKSAFLELLHEKSYMDITVADIVKRAQIARMSFYRKFQSVNEVLESTVDDAFYHFYQDALPVINGNDKRKWREFLFSMLYFLKDGNAKFYSTRKDNIDVLFSRFYAKVGTTEKENPALTLEEKYAGMAKYGFVDGVTHKWMATGMRESPEELVNFMISYLEKLF